MSKPSHALVAARPRLIAKRDISHRISAAGLIFLKSLMTQRALYETKKSAETIHQMRVAARKLRTVLSILKALTKDEIFTSYNEAIKKFMHVLGDARDQDIFIAMLQAIPSHFHYDLDVQEKAVYGVIAIRDKFYSAIDETIHNQDVNAVFQKLIDIFQSRSFVPAIEYRDCPDLDAVVLDRLYKKVIKQGRKLALQDLMQRHELRIALKRLRYALEFLALERGSTRRKTFGKALEQLLSHLGAANDSFTASRLARDSLSHGNGEIHIMAGMIAGWHGRAVQDNEADLIRTWQKFKSLLPYWKSPV